MANTITTTTPEALMRSIIDNSITELEDDTITYVGNSKFRGCTNLTKVSLPNCTKIGTSTSTQQDRGVFYGCTKLQTIQLPKLEYMYGGTCFYGVGSSSYPCTLVMPKLKEVSGSNQFRQGYFTAIDVGPELTTSLGSNSFYEGTFTALILRKTSGVVSVPNTDAIRNLRNVYVPNDLITSYQQASNWSTRYSGGYITFHAIEGSQYENYYADGTPVSSA